MSAGDSAPGWAEFKLSEDVKFVFRTAPDSSGGGTRRTDMLAGLAAEIAEQRRPIASFIAWARSCLDCSNPHSIEVFDTLYRSYREFCDIRDVPTERRLTHQAIGRAMSAVGVSAVKGGLRGGVRLIGVDADCSSQPDSSFAKWLSDCCDISDPTSREGASALYAAFEEFCSTQGDSEAPVISQTAFGLRLKAVGVHSAPNSTTGRIDRIGIRLLSHVDGCRR